MMITGTWNSVLATAALALLAVVGHVAAAAAMDEAFDGTALDTERWSDLCAGEGAASAIVDGTFRVTRGRRGRAGVMGTPAYALAPAADKILRFSLEFAPGTRLITKNAFAFGLEDAAGGNGILVQTGKAYGYGPWGLVITCDGKEQTSEPFAELNALPGIVWRFEVTPGRVRVYCSRGHATEAGRAVFDSRREAPREGGEWLVPTVPLVPKVLDQSTGTGAWALDRIGYALVDPPPAPSVSLLAGNGHGAELLLASGGQAHASIVVADVAPATVRTAAADLQKTIEESTGALLPVVEESDWTEGPRILVGAGKAVTGLGVGVSTGTGIGDEEAVLLRRGADLVLIGNDEGPFRGTQDAVIEFLNRTLGAHVYMAIPTGKVVPKHGRLAVASLDRRVRPAFSDRPRFHLRSEYPEAVAEYLRWNHCGGVWLDGRHAHFGIAPAETYFDDHPEYYSEIGGRRFAKGEMNWQLCTTNPDVIRLAVAFCRRWLDGRPNDLTAPLSFNDGSGAPTYCMCPECRKADDPDPASGAARRLCAFANAVAREIAVSHPGKGVGIYAYFWTTVPPLEMTLEPNVSIIYAYSDGCALHALDDPDCPPNRDVMQRLKQWHRIAPRMKLYGYYGLLGDYMGLPFCSLRKVVDDARVCADLGMVGSHLDGSSIPGQGLYYWATAQTMWARGESAESLRRRYCEGMFGPASGVMVEYYRALEAMCTTPAVHAPRFAWMMPGPLYVWTDEAIRALNAGLDEASALVTGDSPEARRIEDQKLHVRFAEAFMHLKRAQRAYWRDEAEAHLAAYSEWRKRYLDEHTHLSTRGLVSLRQSVLDAYAPAEPWVPWARPPEIALKKAARRPGMDPLSSADPVWAASSISGGFWDEDIFGAYPTTAADMTYDDNALYVRVRCSDHAMAAVRSEVTTRDGDVWADDCVRLSVAVSGHGAGDADGPAAGRYDFLVNPAGVQRDVRDGDVSWNGDWTATAARSDVLNSRQWAVIVEIPWQTLGLAAAPNELKANLFRHVTTPTVQPVQFLSSTLGPLERTERYASIRLGQ
ncbi:MAG: DUF4838 domain-containing protein [Lentisphaerae bacterium]|nr:DUF4838 domain-containing protein [Lentisphaerota bacterium]